MKKSEGPQQQHKRFIENARQLEADEHKERFEEKLRQIAKGKSESPRNKSSAR